MGNNGKKPVANQEGIAQGAYVREFNGERRIPLYLVQTSDCAFYAERNEVGQLLAGVRPVMLDHEMSAKGKHTIRHAGL